MNLQRINEEISRFKDWVLRQPEVELMYAWNTVQAFWDHWDIDTLDLKTMYDKSLRLSPEDNAWAGHYYPAKKAMMQFIERDSGVVHTMFRELFDENLGVEGRTDRFIYHCDALRDDIMRENPQYFTHHHDDYRAVSLYLAFKMPETYCIYDFNLWQSFMQSIGAKPVPERHDIERFFKVMRTIGKLMAKEEELMEHFRALQARHADVWQGPSLMPVWLFYSFVGDR